MLHFTLELSHAHRVLHRALQRVCESEALPRNVASLIRPPKVEAQEVEILSADQIVSVLKKLKGHHLFPIVALDLATGLRRGELLALSWQDVDFEVATAQIRRSLEETAVGLRFKSPKIDMDDAQSHCRRVLSAYSAPIASGSLR